MDHGHAHPSHNPSPLSLANNDLSRQQTPHHPLSFLGVSNKSTPLRRSPQTPFETPLSLPQRRLQLRNTGFRAPRLPSHRLSTRISRWFSDKDDCHIQRQRATARNRENSPPTVRRRITRGYHTPGSILLEITNSPRSRYSENSTFVPIHEDDQDDSPTHSWYHDAPSTQQSPVTFDTVHDNSNEMKLREISGNAQRSPPPLSSPLARQVRGRSKRSLNLRKTSFPASEHILFLETKLEEVEKSQYSPNTGLSLKDKVKVLTGENNRLQEMIAELEHQFETRLRESVEHKTGLESNLRRKIKLLEEEIGAKDCTIRDLEYRNDISQRDLSNAVVYNAAVERLEAEKRGLEDTNRSLEKRNDVLTELLGQSPTRSHHGFELPSPVRQHQKMTPRPRSMMPRIPTSPTHVASNRPLSLHTSPSPFQHDYFSPLSALIREHDHPCNRGDVDPQKACDDSQSIDSGLGESCSVRSDNEPVSQRSSMHSYASASPAAWGLPLPPSPTEDTVERSSRKRKTRRFASGSTQLKPLVLPTLNSTSGLPQSAPLPAANSYADRREISQQSIDPTTSFLSHSYDTPTQPRRRSKTWAGADALEALEGTSEDHFVSFEEVLANRHASPSMPEPVPTLQDPRNHSNYSHPTDPSSPALVDGMIVEDDSTAFLSNQFEGGGEQSFSSMVGELSITESDVDRGCTEEQTLTTQFLESKLRRPISLQLQTFVESGLPWEEATKENVAQAHLGGDEAPPVSGFSPMVPAGKNFANPLSSPYLPSNAYLQHIEASCSAKRQSSCLDEQEVLSTQGSSVAFPREKSVQMHRRSVGIGLKTVEMLMSNPLKAAPPPSSYQRPKRPHSPLDLLQRKGSPTASLTSVTNRTIFGTISRYTSYVREMRQDPTALARRMIANAWCSNWKRLGKLSWWVLGLFLGPGWKRRVERRQGWEAYDGENIAEAEHERRNGPGPTLGQDTDQRAPSKPGIPHRPNRTLQKRVEFEDARAPRLTQRKEIHDAPRMKCKSCEERSKTSWGKSLYLWGKFSVAIMLAVGGAVIQGPERMLRDCDFHRDAEWEARSEDVDDRHDPGEPDHDTLFDYSLELQDDDDDDVVDGEEAISPVSFRTATSIVPLTSRRKKSPSVNVRPKETDCTFGAPSMDEYDLCDGNGQPRAGRCRAHVIADPPHLRSRDLQEAPSDGRSDLGTLQWMQNLSVKDFERSHDIDVRDRTIRASPRKAGKRIYSTVH